MSISKEFIEEQKRRLEKEKRELESELKDFAEKDPHVKYNWRTKYPDYNPDSVGDDRAAAEAEEESNYMTNLSLEHTLEKKLRDIILALKKIEQGNYGICERCGKEISLKRLRAFPEARLCAQCAKEQSMKK